MSKRKKGHPPGVNPPAPLTLEQVQAHLATLPLCPQCRGTGWYYAHDGAVRCGRCYGVGRS